MRLLQTRAVASPVDGSRLGLSAPDTSLSTTSPSLPTLPLTENAGDLVFVFNFHPVQSYTDYRVGCYKPGPYKARRGCCGLPCSGSTAAPR